MLIVDSISAKPITNTAIPNTNIKYPNIINIVSTLLFPCSFFVSLIYLLFLLPVTLFYVMPVFTLLIVPAFLTPVVLSVVPVSLLAIPLLVVPVVLVLAVPLSLHQSVTRQVSLPLLLYLLGFGLVHLYHNPMYILLCYFLMRILLNFQ